MGLKMMWRVFLCACFLQIVFSKKCSPVEVEEDNYGTIKYPKTGDYPAETQMTCGWKIIPNHADKSSRVVVQFSSVDMVAREEESDYIEVYDGIDELYGTPLAIITGNQVPPPIEATGRAMYIKFETTGVDDQTGSGFELAWSATKCENDCSGNGYCFNETCHCDSGFKGASCSETDCGDMCGGEQRGVCMQSAGAKHCDCKPGYYGGDCLAPQCSGVSKFTATSGNFTDHHTDGGTMNYKANTECQWIIYAPTPPPPIKGQHHDENLKVAFIQLHFNRFSTQYKKDWVHVYDSETPDPEALLGSFSGNVVPIDLVSSTGAMLITFETDIGVAYEGFECSYTTFERSVAGTRTSPHESKTVAGFFAATTFLIGIALGGAFMHSYGNLGNEGDEEGDGGASYSMGMGDGGEGLLDSD